MSEQDDLDSAIEQPTPYVLPLDFAGFSDLIGGIYDCALDPTRWEATLNQICRAFAFDAGALNVLGYQGGSTSFQASVGMDPEWVRLTVECQDEIVAIWGGAERLMGYPLDEPDIASRATGPDVLFKSRFYRECLQPRGIRDCIAFTIARTPTMLGNAAFNRRESADPLGDREVALLRLIAPHVRRAVTISDLFGMKAIETATFGSVLDSFQFGILLVDRGLAIVHANAAANAMLVAHDPILSEKGRVTLRDGATQGALQRAVREAAGDAMALGGKGIGIPAGSKERPSVVHVLPLRQSQVRGKIGARVVAALFIAPASLPPRMPSDALAAIYDLTPAETDIFELIVGGFSQAEIAGKLGVAPSTVKTHLLRLFSKTGCHRQAELLKLATDLSAPVR
jgi:DNA-binding CsgD family transcriptional regulator